MDRRRFDRHLLVVIRDGQTGKQLQSLYGSIVMDGGINHHPISWSPDGSLLACQSIDNHLKLWELASGKEIELFPSEQKLSLAGDSAWSPDGQWLALGGALGDFNVLLCDPKRPAECRVLPPGLRSAGAWTWSPDGQRLGLFDISGPLRIFAVAAGKETGPRLEVPGAENHTNWAVWNTQGDRIAMAGLDGALQVWEPKSGRQLLSLPGGTPLFCLSWSPDGRRLAAGGSDGTVRVWDAAPGYNAGPPPQAGEGLVRRLDRLLSAHKQGLLLQGLGRYAEAEAVLVEVAAGLEGFLQREDEMSSARLNLAIVLTDRGRLLRQVRRWDEAENIYRQALAIRKQLTSLAENDERRGYPAAKEAQLQYELGRMFLEAGMLSRAAVEFREAAKERAGFQGFQLLYPDMLNNSAWFFATCPDVKLRDPSLAVRLAQAAVQNSRGAGGVWNTLGVARYCTGDWKGAIEALTTSVEWQKGGSSFDFFFLAMAHWQLDEKDKARDWYDKAVAWMDKNKPHDEELHRFRSEAAALLGIKEPNSVKESPTPKP